MRLSSLRKGDIWLGLLLLVLLAYGLTAMPRAGGNANPIAVVKVDGELVKEVRLNEVNEPFIFVTKGAAPGAYNQIQFEPGRVRVVDASCPDRLCVKQGWISRPGQSLVCPPNRLVVTITDEGAQAKGPDGLTF